MIGVDFGVNVTNGRLQIRYKSTIKIVECYINERQARLSVSKKSTRFKSKSLFESFRLRVRAFARAALTAPALYRSDFCGTRPRKPHF